MWISRASLHAKALAAIVFLSACTSEQTANNTQNGITEERLPLASLSVDGLGEAMTSDGTPIEVPAVLYLPAGAGPGAPAPAVVVLHGGGGQRATREPALGRDLARAGVAALVVDTYGGRGIAGRDALDQMRQASIADQAADAAAARSRLAAHPAIDGDKIHLAGTSLGGWTSIAMADRIVAEGTGANFAGYVALYAPCAWRPGAEGMVAAPVLLLLGKEDTSIDPAACRDMAEAMASAGATPDLVLYDGAAHTFIDSSLSAGSIPFPLARACQFTPAADGSIREASGGMVATTDAGFIDAFLDCADQGGRLTANSDPSARRDAITRIVAMAKGG